MSNYPDNVRITAAVIIWLTLLLGAYLAVFIFAYPFTGGHVLGTRAGWGFIVMAYGCAWMIIEAIRNSKDQN